MMAGLYFAFSTFIMSALSRIPQAAGISAMNAINMVILKSLFAPLFWGTTIAGLALAVLALIGWGQPGAIAMLAGGAIHVVGMFAVTVTRNVPLNNMLAAADPAAAQSASTCTRYLRDWTIWNHVRTFASVAACALFIAAIAAR